MRIADRLSAKYRDNQRITNRGVRNPRAGMEILITKFFTWTGLILLAAVVGLALAFVFTKVVQPRTSVVAGLSSTNQATPYPSGRPWGYGPGMMGQGGPGYSSGGMGSGMMGGGYRSGVQGQVNPGSSSPITLDQAVEAANQYLSAYGNSDLALTEVMEFSNNFYAEVKEKSTGIHAFEVLIDPYTGVISPEPGPNMMWNTKYGSMGGMMGGWGRQQGKSMSVTPEQAQIIAQKWLDKSLPGTSAAEQADAFYGYYTIHIMQEGQVYGMLSVNGYTGDVWYHTWHGEFAQMKELEE